MDTRRRLATFAVVLALSAAIVALALFVFDAGRGADVLRPLLAPGDPDLAAFAAPFSNASTVALLTLVGALVLGVLLLVAGRRLLFGLSAVWSLLTLAGLAMWLAPISGPMPQWQVLPVALPIEALDPLLTAACLACLASSVAGWLVTPFGWNWLSGARTAADTPKLRRSPR